MRQLPRTATLALALALAGAGPARAQLTVSQGTGRYAPGTYTGPCKQEAPSSDIPLESTTRSLTEATIFSFANGGVAGKVLPPACVPVQLDPGKYVMKVMHVERVLRLHCQFRSGDECKAKGFAPVSDNNYDSDTPFTIDATCKPPTRARIKYLVGTAYDAAGNRMRVGSELPVGGVVVTGRGTRLSFSDAAGEFLVGPNTRFTNDNHLCEREPHLTASLILGTIWNKVAKVVRGDEKFEVFTVTAIAGVRGTAYQVEVRDSAGQPVTIVRVSEGTVMVHGIASGKAVAVHANQMTRVVGDAPPERPRPLPPGVSADPPGGWPR